MDLEGCLGQRQVGLLGLLDESGDIHQRSQAYMQVRSDVS